MVQNAQNHKSISKYIHNVTQTGSNELTQPTSQELGFSTPLPQSYFNLDHFSDPISHTAP